MDNLKFKRFYKFLFQFLLGITIANLQINPLLAQTDIQQPSSSFQVEIKPEVDRTLARTSTLLNFWIVVAVLVPTSATVCLLILGIKAFRETQQTQQSLNTVKSDILSQIHAMISETQPIVDELQNSIQVTEAKINQLQSQGFGGSLSQENSSKNPELQLPKTEVKVQDAPRKEFFPSN